MFDSLLPSGIERHAPVVRRAAVPVEEEPAGDRREHMVAALQHILGADAPHGADADLLLAALRENAQEQIRTSPPGKRAAIERDVRVLSYLGGSLWGEERVALPMDSRCEVVVVVPCFAERAHIVRLLTSLAQQQDVDAASYEALIVVNNPPAPPERQPGWPDAEMLRKQELYEKAVPENQETLALIRWLNDPAAPAPAMSGDERSVLDAVRASGVRIQAVDKASLGRTFSQDEANVGGARNRGIAEAVERFFLRGDDGIIVWTDADSQLAPDYIKNLTRLYAEEPDLLGVAGRLDWQREEGDEFFTDLLATYGEAESYLPFVVEMFHFFRTGNRAKAAAWEDPVRFLGANMSSRAFIAAEIGGVKRSLSREGADGGEDTSFGERLAQRGRVMAAPMLRVITSDRDSARTSMWAGAGQKRLQIGDAIRSDGQVLVDMPVDPGKSAAALSELEARMAARDVTTEYLLQLSAAHDWFISHGDAELLAQRLAQYTSLRGLGDDPVVPVLYRKLKAQRQKVPIEHAILALATEVEGDPRYGRRYGEELSRMISSEVALQENRIALLRRMLAVVFAASPVPGSPDDLLDLLARRREDAGLTMEQLAELRERRSIVVALLQALAEGAPDAAFERLLIDLAPLLQPIKPGSIREGLLKLRAIDRALRPRP